MRCARRAVYPTRRNEPQRSQRETAEKTRFRCPLRSMIKRKTAGESQPSRRTLTGLAPSRRSVCAPATMSFHCIADRNPKGSSMIAIVFGAVLPWLLIAVGTWLGYQLVRQNGRILLRLESIEKYVRHRPTA